MRKSTKSKTADKPAKPYEGFPLFAHASGRWAKKIGGDLHYFGRWAKTVNGELIPVDDVAASAEQALELYTGRTTKEETEKSPSIKTVVNAFLNAKRELLDNEEITERSFRDYYQTCGRIVDVFGRTRLVSDLDASDFRKLRSKLAKTRGPVALGNEIGRIRMVFRFAYDEDLIDKPIRYGQSFNKPSKKVLRDVRKQNGPRMFQAHELRRMLDALDGKITVEVEAKDRKGKPVKKRKRLKADPVMKAMVLLAANCGFGQSDLSNLPQTAVDLDRGWIEYPRPKTSIDRRCPLWPETVEAVREAIAQRPDPQDPADDHLVFLTQRGNRWVRSSDNEDPGKRYSMDALAQKFGKLMKSLDINGKRNFYAIRHGFQTVGGDAKDPDAVSSLMGHASDDMASLYREGIPDDRLQAVVDVVRNWLFAEPKRS